MGEEGGSRVAEGCEEGHPRATKLKHNVTQGGGLGSFPEGELAEALTDGLQ